MGLHTGEPKVGEERYVGIGVHRAARIGAAGHGGQVLLSSTTKELAEEELPPGVTIRDLGERRLKDIDQPQRIYQLDVEGLQSDFAQLKTLDVELERKRRRMYAGAALIGVLAAAVAVPVFAFGQGGSGGGTTVKGNAVAVIDPSSDSVVGEVPVGARPGAIAAGSGSIWVANLDDQTVSRIDASKQTVSRTFPVDDTPTGLASSRNAVWVVGSPAGKPFVAVRRDRSAVQHGRRPRDLDRQHRRSRRLGRDEVAAGLGRAVVGPAHPPRPENRAKAAAGRPERWPQRDRARAGCGLVHGFLGQHRDAPRPRHAICSPRSRSATARAASPSGPGRSGSPTRSTTRSFASIPGRGRPRTPCRSARARSASQSAAARSGSPTAATGRSRASTRPRRRRRETIHVGGSPQGVVISDGRVWVTVQNAVAGLSATAAAGGTLRAIAQSDVDSMDTALAYTPRIVGAALRHLREAAQLSRRGGAGRLEACPRGRSVAARALS